MVSGKIKTLDPSTSILAVCPACVCTRESGKIAATFGAGASFSQVPPSLCSKPRVGSCAANDAGKMRINRRQTKWLQSGKHTSASAHRLAQEYLVDSPVAIDCNDANNWRVNDLWARAEQIKQSGYLSQTLAKSIYPCCTSVRMSFTRSLSPTSSPLSP